MSLFYARRRLGKTGSFTLVELLTVILIIAILMALTIAASEGVLNMAARSRARSEIAAMGSALENYKTDNAIYPSNDFGVPPTNYPQDPTVGSYTNGAQILFQALTGITNFGTDTPQAGETNYMSFKANQLSGNTDTGVQDPFGYAYGYNTGDTNGANAPNNGIGFFDLWSTGGAISNSGSPSTTATNSWISNWTQ